MYAKLAILGAVIAFVIGVYFYGRSDGYSSRDAEYAEAARIEQERQTAQNEAAQRKSQERERELLSEIARLRTLSRRLIDEAYQDPDADRPAIGVDSVRRLNRLNESAGPQ